MSSPRDAVTQLRLIMRSKNSVACRLRVGEREEGGFTRGRLVGAFVTVTSIKL